jgi:hypothetical protein
MAELYGLLPHVALSHHFVACHAAPPTSKVTRSQLADIREYPKLQKQITRGRLRLPQSASGYGRGDVARFRRRVGLEDNAPVLVGHTPLDPDETLWLNAGGIANHHVLFGAHPRWAGVIARVGRHLLPLRYPAEPLATVLNQMVGTGRGLRL